MVSSKQLDKYFSGRVSKNMGVKASKNTEYSSKPKEDIYSIGKAYGGYRVEKQAKGSSGQSDISDRYSAKEMDIYLKGMNAGANIKGGKHPHN